LGCWISRCVGQFSFGRRFETYKAFIYLTLQFWGGPQWTTDTEPTDIVARLNVYQHLTSLMTFFWPYIFHTNSLQDNTSKTVQTEYAATKQTTATCCNYNTWQLTFFMEHILSWTVNILTFESLPVISCTERFNIQKLCIMIKLRLCVLYGSQNKQQFSLYTSLTDWFFTTEVENIYYSVCTEPLYNTHLVLREFNDFCIFSKIQI
jgi:hypothetical protein